MDAIAPRADHGEVLGLVRLGAGLRGGEVVPIAHLSMRNGAGKLFLALGASWKYTKRSERWTQRRARWSVKAEEGSGNSSSS